MCKEGGKRKSTKWSFQSHSYPTAPKLGRKGFAPDFQHSFYSDMNPGENSKSNNRKNEDESLPVSPSIGGESAR